MVTTEKCSHGLEHLAFHCAGVRLSALELHHLEFWVRSCMGTWGLVFWRGKTWDSALTPECAQMWSLKPREPLWGSSVTYGLLCSRPHVCWQGLWQETREKAGACTGLGGVPALWPPWLWQGAACHLLLCPPKCSAISLAALGRRASWALGL